MDAGPKYVGDFSFFLQLTHVCCFLARRPFNSDWTVQRLLIGTHTSNDEQNYVQIIKVKIPLESSKDTREYREGLDEPGQAQQNAAATGARVGPAGAMTTGQATAAQGGADCPKNERIQVELQINH